MSTRVLGSPVRLFCQNFFKSSKFFSISLIFLLASLSVADWVSFDDGRVRSSTTERDIVTCSDITVQANTCNLSIDIPGAFENKPDDFGLLAGNYSVFSLYGSALKIVNNNISGTFRPEKLGEPNLPQARFHVLVPYSVNADQVEIKIINTDFKPLVGLHEIGPIQEQVIDSYYPGIHRDTRVFQKNMEIYGKNEFFTHPLEYETYIVNKYRILEIRYCPMQYNPVTNKVLATKKAQFVITYNGAVINNTVKPNNFTNTIYKTTFNGITGTRNQPYVQVSRGGKFVIVSGAPLIDSPTMTEFIAYREGQGYEHVKTIDADANNSSAITSELKSLFTSDDIEYVLVIGDEEVVEIPTGGEDYHYKDWGWLSGSDTQEDIMLGIFLCNTETGFKQIVQRQKWQEAGGEWTKTVISTLGQQDTENPLKRFSSGHYGTRNWDDPEGVLDYTVHRVYKASTRPTQGYGGGYNIPGPQDWEEWALEPDPFYSSSSDAAAKIYEYWNEGTCLIFHRDHGSNSGPSSPSIRMSSTVTTQCSPLFLSMNCLTGNFKGRHTSNFAYLTQSKEIGTCTTLGATVVTYSGDNDLYAMAIFKGMVPEDGSPNERRVGQMHILGSMKGQKHSRTFFHNYGDVLTLVSMGNLSPFIMVSSPAEGEELEQNTSCEIRWGDNIDGNVKIELLKGGSVAEVLAASTESDGILEWDIAPDFTTGTDYSIRITSLDSASLNHEGPLFSITPEFIIATYPYIEPFDDLEKGSIILPRKWEQLADDDLNWTVWQGLTPTKEPDQGAATGPDADHTSGSGKYLYVESSSPNNPDKKAGYVTPKFNLTVLQKPELSFWYHMFSDNEGTDEMGDLYLDISVDGVWKNDVFHMSKDQGDKWIEQIEDLTDHVGERVIFRFRAITGSGWASDVCIDDFMITGDPTSITNVSVLPTEFDLRYFGNQVKFQVPDNKLKSANVTIRLYNLQGRMIRTLFKDKVKPGYHSINLHGNQKIAAGMYQCILQTKGFVKRISIVLMR